MTQFYKRTSKYGEKQRHLLTVLYKNAFHSSLFQEVVVCRTILCVQLGRGVHLVSLANRIAKYIYGITSCFFSFNLNIHISSMEFDWSLVISNVY